MGRHYPDQPVLAVSGIAFCGDRVLLVKRGVAPAKGLWSVPGGAVEVGESLAEGCAREIMEETGIPVEVGPLVEVVERVRPDDQGRTEYHYVILDFLCSAGPVEPVAGDDAAEARWVRLSDLSNYSLTADTSEIINKADLMRRK